MEPYNDALHASPTQLADAVTDDDAFAGLPVGVRMVIAAAALAALDQRVTTSAVAAAAGVSRSTACRKGSPWRPLIDAIAADPTGLLDRLAVDRDTAGSLTAAAAEIARRDELLARRNAELAKLRRSINPLRSYAHDVAIELRRYRDDEQAELDRRVRHLHGAPDLKPTEEDA